MPAREMIGHSVILRLVEDQDAAYIWQLRNDSRYNAHLSKSAGTVEDQRHWIASYQGREALGTEFYFIVFNKATGARCGTVRLYEIHDGQFTWGSWILDENKPAKAALDSAIQVYRYGFDELGLAKSAFDVRKENLRTLSFHDRFGGQRTGEDDANIYYEISRARFREVESRYAEVLK